MLVAKNKLQQSIIRQKMKSNTGSDRYDFNLHLALIDALRALSVIENKKPAPSLKAGCRHNYSF